MYHVVLPLFTVLLPHCLPCFSFDSHYHVIIPLLSENEISFAHSQLTHVCLSMAFPSWYSLPTETETKWSKPLPHNKQKIIPRTQKNLHTRFKMKHYCSRGVSPMLSIKLQEKNCSNKNGHEQNKICC